MHAWLWPRRAVVMELSADYLREKLRQDLEAEHVVSAMPGGRGRRGRAPGRVPHRLGLLPARRWRTRLRTVARPASESWWYRLSSRESHCFRDTGEPREPASRSARPRARDGSPSIRLSGWDQLTPKALGCDSALRVLLPLWLDFCPLLESPLPGDVSDLLGHVSFGAHHLSRGRSFPIPFSRSRLVNECLAEELPHIHAFEQKTLTPEQWTRQRRE